MKGAPRVVILAYHSLTPWPRDPLGIAPSEFERQIAELRARGWRCLSLSDWTDHLERGTRPGAPSVVLTFDDGYADILSQAAPILERHGWTATMFPVIDALNDGRPFEHDRVRLRHEPALPDRRSMNWDEAREWVSRGLDVGSRVRSQRPLTDLGPHVLREELATSRSELRKRLGTGDLFFAYPHGRLDSAVVGAVRDAGYRAAVLTPHVGNVPRTPWTMPRVAIYASDTARRFHFKLHGVFPLARATRFLFLGRSWPREEIPRCQRLQVVELTTSSEVGGIEKMLGRLVPALKEQAIDAHVVSLERNGPADLLLREEGVRPLGLRARSLVPAIVELAELLRARQIDCIHAYGTRALLAARAAGWLARGITGVVPRVVTGVLSTNHGADRVRGSADRLTAALSDVHLSNSEAGAHAVIARRIVSSRKVRMIHDGIDLEHDTPTRTRAEVRAELGVGADDHVIITIANLRPMKGHASLLHAAVRVLERHPSAFFLIVGQDRMGGSLQALAAWLLPPQNVRFLGYRTDVTNLLAASDVFALASDWEGLPVSILEAMLAGLPVVATRASGIPEAVRDGEEGWLVPPRDPERLAAAIVRLLGDRNAATAMGQRARQRVLEEFSLEGAARRTAELYRELVRNVGAERRVVPWSVSAGVSERPRKAA